MRCHSCRCPHIRRHFPSHRSQIAAEVEYVAVAGAGTGVDVDVSTDSGYYY
jgi:hypothetical protein